MCSHVFRHGSDASSLTLDEQDWSALHDDAWQRVAITIGFLRANAAHDLRYSFLALLPTLRLLTNELFRDGDRKQWELSMAAASTLLKVKGLNADRFISTRFCQSHLPRFVGRGGEDDEDQSQDEEPVAAAAAAAR